MRYQVQENCLTIYLPREVDHHNADEISGCSNQQKSYQICDL